MVLLDGFPEFQYAWRHQIPALAEAGYRVAGPDLPGYNASYKPPRVRDYRPGCWPKDVADLIVALGAGSATVAGHDWGGALAWLLAMQHPEHVERLVVLNAISDPLPQEGLRSAGSCGAAGTCSHSSPRGCPSGWWGPRPCLRGPQRCWASAHRCHGPQHPTTPACRS